MCKECHVVVVKTRIKSLVALDRAVKRLGWQFLVNQRQYRWYGNWMDDYHKDDAAYLQGIEVKDYGKCDHAIHVPGCQYEIGIVKQGGEFALVWDYVDYNLQQAMGGKDGKTLIQSYNAELSKLQAQLTGYSYEESIEQDGTITVTCTSWE